MPIFRVENLSFAYPGQPLLLRDWCHGVAPGVTLMYGDTGSGKSTLIRLLAAEATRQGIGVFHVEPGTDEFDRLDPHECAATLGSGDTGFDEVAWRALVEGFALTPHLHKKVYMLSTGSKRKVWLAAALASSRPLVLLDEPTAGLDAPSIACLWSALGRAATRTDRAVIVASSERFETVAWTGRIELPVAP